MNAQLEKYLQDIIFPDLEKGRPDWDKPHTISVVDKIKQLIEYNSSLDLAEDVLIIAAYAHDWGYSGLFENGVALNLDLVNSAKDDHARIGKQKIENLLQKSIFEYLSVKRKNRIAHLVYIHDRVEDLNDTDELILMEADTLGGLDISYVVPTFDYDSNKRYINGVINKRLPKFITEYGKSMAKKLIDDRSRYYKEKYDINK